MTSDTAWIEEARRMREQGISVLAISMQIGKSEYFIRRTLNINGTADKLEREKIEKRTGPAKRYVASGRRSRAGQSAKSYVPPPAPRGISLPKLSILSTPIEEAKPTFCLAPKTYCRVENPGVERYRAKHLEMLRSGRISEPSMSLEMHS